MSGGVAGTAGDRLPMSIDQQPSRFVVRPQQELSPRFRLDLALVCFLISACLKRHSGHAPKGTTQAHLCLEALGQLLAAAHLPP